MADEVGLSTPLPHKEHRPSVVFPPTNHEGLNLHHQFGFQETYNDSANPSSPASSELKPAAMVGHVAVKWLFSHFKLPCLFRSLNFPLFGSTILLLLFYLRLRLRQRRWRVRKETIDGLLGVIKEKDERINHLLYQIARMNELLLALHHGVPITSRAASG